MWLVTVAVLLFMVQLNDAGALKCSPDSSDPACYPDNQSKLSAKCEPNSLSRDECGNMCRCSPDGKLFCTKRGCVLKIKMANARRKRSTGDTMFSAYEYNRHSVTKRAVCKSNQQFQVDCNQCKCASNGLSYTCTQNECLERDMNKEVEVFMESDGSDHIERATICKPREHFSIGCNPCLCNPFGTYYSCTNKPCPLPKDVEIISEDLKGKTTSAPNSKVVCVANRMFIKDCNTCWCNEDGTSYFCTRRVCIENADGFNKEGSTEELKLRTINKECTPNEVFPIDCNMCRCEPDGKSFYCTRRLCEPNEKITSLNRNTRATPEPPKTCQPGQEFRMDCNKCLCNDEGQDFSCTRIDCAALNNNGGADSFASARAKRETPQSEDGPSKQTENITAKEVDKPVTEERNVKVTQLDNVKVRGVQNVTMKCVPGSVFDQDCNVCRCTEDGEHATCTVKRCHHEVKDNEVTTEASYRCDPGDQFRRDCNDCTCAADGKTVFCTLRFCDTIDT